jgi:DUF4097 and DUF4098 domain-containing protein YvlB
LASKSGNVTLNNIESAVKTSTISGSILMKNVSGILELKSISGDIQGYMVQLDNDSRFESISGNIYLGLADNTGKYDFDLHSVSGNMQVGGAKAKGELLAKNGKVQIFGKTVSGEQIYE